MTGIFFCYLINFKQIPLIRFIIPFILGIILGIYQDFSSSIFFSLFLFCFVLYTIGVFIRRYRIFYGRYYFFHEGILHICLFLGGIVIVIFNTDYNYKDHYKYQDHKGAIYHVEISSPIHIKPRSIQCEVEIKKMIYKDKSVKTCGKGIVYFEKSYSSLNLLPGDMVQLNANWNTVKKSSNPGQFNYKLFLRFHQIYDQMYVNKENWNLISRNNYSIFNISNRCRNYFLDLFKRAGMKDQEFAVATALTLGYKDEISNEIKHAYSSAGAMHVLAVSGLHVGIIYMIFNSFLSIFLRYRKTNVIKTIIILLLLWSYALITGLSPSVLRATTMLSFIIIGRASNRDSNIYNSLAASAFFLLIIDPYLIMQVGFQLSYIAVVGILFFQPRLYNKIKFKNKILDYIWIITAVSLAAQLVTFPLGLLYFHQFPTYFMISNLLVIPAAYIMLLLGVLLLLSSVYLPISALFGWAINLIVGFINDAVMYIDNLPFSLIEGISISIKETYLIYLIIISISIGFTLRRFKWVNYGLIMLMFLFSFDIYEDQILKNKKQIVIYDVKGNEAIDFIVGKEHLFLTEDKLFNDQASMLFNIKHHWYDLDLNQPIYRNINSLNKLSLISKNDTLVYVNNDHFIFGGIDLFLAQSDFCKPIDESSIILLSGQFEGDLIEFIQKYSNNQFIGMSDLSYIHRSQIDII